MRQLLTRRPAAVCEHHQLTTMSWVFFLIDDHTLFKLHAVRRDLELTNILQPTAERNPPSQVKSRFEVLTRRRAHMLRQMGKQNNSPLFFFFFFFFFSVCFHSFGSVCDFTACCGRNAANTQTGVYSSVQP